MEHRIDKANAEVKYNAECVVCGATDKMELWPHRNERGGMVGFLFACHGCSPMIQGTLVNYGSHNSDAE